MLCSLRNMEKSVCPYSDIMSLRPICWGSSLSLAISIHKLLKICPTTASTFSPASLSKFRLASIPDNIYYVIPQQFTHTHTHAHAQITHYNTKKQQELVTKKIFYKLYFYTMYIFFIIFTLQQPAACHNLRRPANTFRML